MSRKAATSLRCVAALQNLADISSAPDHAPASWSRLRAALSRRGAVKSVAIHRFGFARLVHLYEAWGKPAQAVEWKQKLEALPKPE